MIYPVYALVPRNYRYSLCHVILDLFQYVLTVALSVLFHFTFYPELLEWLICSFSMPCWLQPIFLSKFFVSIFCYPELFALSILSGALLTCLVSQCIIILTSFSVPFDWKTFIMPIICSSFTELFSGAV